MTRYLSEQHRIDSRDGSRAVRFIHDKPMGETCMSGEVMEAKPAVSDDDMRRLREFVANHLAHCEDAKAVLPMLGRTQLFVRLNGTLYHVRRSYSSSPLELPVLVSEATVIGD